MELEDFINMSDNDFIAMTSSVKETTYDAFWSIVVGGVAGAGTSPFAYSLAEKLGYPSNNKEKLILITLLVSGAIASGAMYGSLKKAGKGTTSYRKENFNRLKKALGKLTNEDLSVVKKMLVNKLEDANNKNINEVLYYTRSLGQEKLIISILNNELKQIKYEDSKKEKNVKNNQKQVKKP